MSRIVALFVFADLDAVGECLVRELVALVIRSFVRA